MIQEAERCLEVTDGTTRFGVIMKFKDDPTWIAYVTMRNYPYRSDLLGVFENPRDAFKALAAHEWVQGYDIRKDETIPEEFK